MIIGTTHLFWHPRQVYERVRQLGLWVRSVQRFRMQYGLQDWPIILAGDYNVSLFFPILPKSGLNVRSDATY